MELSVTIHIIGIVFWVGALLFVPFAAKKLLPIAPQAYETLRRMFLTFAVSGTVLVISSGLFQLMYRGFSYYMKAGWFHTKLTLVIALIVLTFLVLKELGKKSEAKPGLLMAYHGGSAIILLVIVYLTERGVAAVYLIP